MKSILLLILLSTFAAFAGELVLDSPEAVSTDTIASYKITYFEVDIESQVLVIRSNAIDSSGKLVKSQVSSFEGVEFLALIASMPDPSKNIYDNLSILLYNKLKESVNLPGQVIP